MHSGKTRSMFVSQSLVKQRLINSKPENMKQLVTLLAATLLFTAVYAGGTPYTTPIKINVAHTSLNISLQAAGKVSINWSAIAAETSTTVYEIQKRTEAGAFKTIAVLMGESYPSYSFRDKLTAQSGAIEYRIVVLEGNQVVNTVAQSLIVL